MPESKSALIDMFQERILKNSLKLDTKDKVPLIFEALT